MIKIRHVDWYADEWLAGTSKLGPNEGWLYTTIVNLIYSHSGPIEDDERWLARVANMHWRTVRTARKRLLELGKIQSEAGHIMVRRCSREVQKALTRSSEAIQNGLKGGRPSNKTNGVAKPDGFQSQKANDQPTNLSTSKKEDAFQASKKEPVSSKANGHTPATLGSFLSREWWPDDKDTEFAERMNLDALEVADSFRDFWFAKSGADGRKRDWSATWRTWCRRHAQSLQRKGDLL